MKTTLHPILKELATARREARISQRALGKKIGLAQSHVSKIERGSVDPQLSNLLEIARALGLELMLVPKRLVPAVRALTRPAVRDGGVDQVPAYRLDETDE
ncbi:MAG: helix-turn-helix transcriptional regulator [Gammaproteobacteria bacterium]|nr:helix-turn-helix transcriptional regulator [Gammaproteobacteria bacterium]